MKDASDLPENENDRLHLQQEHTIIQLPDVEDIPGQEYIKVPLFKEFVDITIASDGDEGVGIFDQERLESDLSENERSLLHACASQTPGDVDEKDINIISLDKNDNEGDPLNEGNLLTDRFGEDLDLPEAEEVDQQ
ncbi:MAG TPA: hypothetical protein VNV85_01330 [Puia sp.]|nr:hypothetical protein [Puia sp.]